MTTLVELVIWVGQELTQKVPGLDVDGDVPHAEQAGDTNDDTETEHGNQGNALAKGDLDGCEVFGGPEENEDYAADIC
jgi:hypothetical protein